MITGNQFFVLFFFKYLSPTPLIQNLLHEYFLKFCFYHFVTMVMKITIQFFRQLHHGPFITLKFHTCRYTKGSVTMLIFNLQVEIRLKVIIQKQITRATIFFNISCPRDLKNVTGFSFRRNSNRKGQKHKFLDDDAGEELGQDQDNMQLEDFQKTDKLDVATT